MGDSKTVISQVEKLQVILHEIHSEGMVLSETFQEVAVIEKLPPAWKDFKHYLKHKRNEIDLNELVVRLQIGEYNKKSFEIDLNELVVRLQIGEYNKKSEKKESCQYD
ncbi:hypothetical protein ACOSQ2_031152 [Xanthoceras sorbifolium]